MRVLILGGTGMLGHKLYQTFVPHFDTYVTFRRRPEPHWTIFDNAHVLNGVAAEDFDTVVRAFETARAQVVVNCVGIIKQSPTAKDSVTTITVNSLLPHRLARLCLDGGARLIQLSTDCIFSGRKGNYSETATPDAEDLYGRSKLLGEVEGSNCLTLRTSMIGRELERSDGLLEWFLSQNGKTVRGFTRAIFSGFTTNALANIIAQIVTSHPGLNGLKHVAAQPITKAELLNLIREVYGLDIIIEPDDSFVCDRSLDGSRFGEETGIAASSWPEMITQMHDDPTPYEELRRNYAER